MKSYKKVLILIVWLILSVIGWLGITFAENSANIIVSTAYSSLDSCKSAVDRNNKLYPDYKRSKCYEKDGYYYYNICNKDTSSCEASISNNANNNGRDKSSVLWSCELTENYVYIKWKLKDKVDWILVKLDKKLENNSKIVNGYIYGFYDYMLGKLWSQDKYKNNKVVQELIKYLWNKFRCWFKKNIWDPQESVAESFL
jgi:flagellin-specific chaperone FliS